MVDESVLKGDIDLECQMCFTKSGILDWEKSTYEACHTREMRRKFTTLRSVKAYRKKKGSCYKCPSCGRWVNGDCLIIWDENGNKVEGLAGHSMLSLDSRKM